MKWLSEDYIPPNPFMDSIDSKESKTIYEGSRDTKDQDNKISSKLPVTGKINLIDYKIKHHPRRGKSSKDGDGDGNGDDKGEGDRDKKEKWIPLKEEDLIRTIPRTIPQTIPQAQMTRMTPMTAIF